MLTNLFGFVNCDFKRAFQRLDYCNFWDSHRKKLGGVEIWLNLNWRVGYL
jgi:hypothetical protein